MLRRPATFLAAAVFALVGCGGDGSARIDELIGRHDGATTRDAGIADDPDPATNGAQPSDTSRAGTDVEENGSTPATAAGDEPTFLPTVCPFEIEVELTVTCGVVEVPESRDVNGRNTVELAVAILRTPAADPAPDPVVYLAGGPGGVSLAEHFMWLGGATDWRDHPILARRDMVLVDQRGTGYSRPSLWCDDDQEWPEDCHQRLVDAGLTLSAYSTHESAADLVDVRRALGVETWNLYGSSYGTRLGLTVLRDHPEGVRSLVLEGIYPPDVVPAYHEYVDNTLRALGEMNAACAAEAACAERFGDVGQLLLQALRTADATPGSPVDALDLMDMVFGSLYFVEGLLDVPLALELAAGGALDEAVDVLSEGAPGFAPARSSRRPTIHRPWAHGALAAGDPAEDSAGLFHSIECREEMAFTSLDAIERRADELFEAGVDELLLDVLIAGIAYPIDEICPWWDSGMSAPDERRPTVSDVPVLLLSGRFDPITPPAWGDRAAATLSRATHVVSPSLSHSLVIEDPCIDSIVADFLGEPGATPDTSCTAGMRLPAFTQR